MKKPRILVTSSGGHTGTPAPPLAVGAGPGLGARQERIQDVKSRMENYYE